MKKILALSLFCFSFCYGVTIKTNERFYPVLLTPNKDVYTTIYDSAPRSTRNFMHSISNKILGEYQPEIELEVGYSVYHNKECKVKEILITLHSNFLFPRLDSSSHVSKQLRTSFLREFEKIKSHEKEHERIYIQYLLQLKKGIQLIGEQRQNCNSLHNAVEQLENNMFKDLELQNLKFDCNEYGYKMGLNECSIFRNR